MRHKHLIPTVLLLWILPAVALADPIDVFLERARSYHAEDVARFPSLRAELARDVPDLFLMPLPPCPLRSALAKSLSPDEARMLLDDARHDEEALPIVVGNLAARRDLAALVLATGAYERLEALAPRLLVQVALNALLDGDDACVRRLLEGPAFERTADALVRLPHPEGLRTLCDVVARRTPISDAARARLATYEPDTANWRPTCPLGRARVDALLGVALTDEDAAMRALAARLLLRADDPAIAEETVRAHVDARSAHLTDDDWYFLGKLASAPVTDARVAIADRLALLRCWLVWTWVRAEEQPVEADRKARALRQVLAASEPRFRGEATLLLVDHDGLFVTTTHGRKRAVPAMHGILEDLDAGRDGDPPALNALGREAAARLRAVFAEEEGYPEVRIEERPLAAETVWRSAPPSVDTVLAGVVDGIDGIEAFEGALTRIEDPGLPPSSRLALFRDLRWIAQEGRPPSREGDDEAGFDRRYLDRLAAWLITTAGALDGGLAECVIRAFRMLQLEDASASATVHDAFERAVETVATDGPRRRLEALRDRLH